ncbi:MAG TPA: hypothetical protein VGB42_11350 [Candidatus Thermoplasmatota archaeon]
MVGDEILKRSRRASSAPTRPRILPNLAQPPAAPRPPPPPPPPVSTVNPNAVVTRRDLEVVASVWNLSEELFSRLEGMKLSDLQTATNISKDFKRDLIAVVERRLSPRKVRPGMPGHETPSLDEGGGGGTGGAGGGGSTAMTEM